MDTALRLVRTYARFHELIWTRLRAAAVPILVLVGVATVIAWAIGTQTGNQLMVWSPAAYAWTLACSYALTRALDTPSR